MRLLKSYVECTHILWPSITPVVYDTVAERLYKDLGTCL